MKEKALLVEFSQITHTHTHTQNSKKQTRPATVEVKNNNLCMSPKERTNSRNEGKRTIGRILSNHTHTQTSKKQNTNATTTLCEMQNGLLKGEKSFFFKEKQSQQQQQQQHKQQQGVIKSLSIFILQGQQTGRRRRPFSQCLA